MQAAMVARTIAEIYRDKDKRPQAFKLDEFMIDFWDDKPAAKTVDDLSEAQQISWLEMLNDSFGGVDKRTKKPNGESR